MPKVVVLSEYCKSCGLCVEICPKKILSIGDKVNQKGYYTVTVTEEEKCTGCTLCGLVCPDLALEIYK
ncbi:MAG: 4Fe-4S dicluster domain-containing protein [Bacillota bacterium]|uniref:4Fe-4S dicluster domain-containing protein n=1 Tax=Thermanaerosceptrum fracticalcis TaxID=1712410 RepID=A0A7G6E3R0_THEFR|nr:4Fe-4S dicluster domain-containing protein [Thermanaerosceptrum fracticalcis]QNB46714.1 4Fe-4S dicluster domain-containing protein [Thermanaerosceptrum fracticalcis]